MDEQFTDAEIANLDELKKAFAIACLKRLAAEFPNHMFEGKPLGKPKASIVKANLDREGDEEARG